MSDFLKVMIVCLMILVALLLFFFWIFARLWCRPRKRILSATPDDFGPPSEDIWFSSHNVSLKGWFFPPEPATSLGPAVVLVHGWSSTGIDMLPLARPLQQSGFGVFTFDARGHGASGKAGPITILKFAEDISASLDYLENRPDVDRKRIGVVGFSMGGSAAILAASSESRIRALVCCSAFADPAVITAEYMKKLHILLRPFLWLVMAFIEQWLGTRVCNVTPLNRIGQVKAPTLLIHGGTDRYISPDDLEILYNHSDRQNTEKQLLPGCSHFDIIKDSRCIREAVMFLRKNLSHDALGTN